MQVRTFVLLEIRSVETLKLHTITRFVLLFGLFIQCSFRNNNNNNYNGFHDLNNPHNPRLKLL